jgi:pyruvate dehydrogenase E1 component beta subunit
MLAGALADPDPVLLFEHAALYNMEGDPGESPTQPDPWSAVLRRRGEAASVITYGGSLPKCLAAADALEARGVAVDVLDLRSLRPLDDAALLATARRTRRVVVVDEGWRSGSLAAEISARITEQAFYDLDAPVLRVCSAEVPMPYAKHLEEAALPHPDTIVAAVDQVMRDG